MTENRSPYLDPGEDTIDLSGFYLFLKKSWWKIGLLSGLVGASVLLYAFTLPNIYRATAVIAPSSEEAKPGAALSALASFGVTLGGPTKVEDLESIFLSNDLTVRVFGNHNLWPVILGEDYDPKTGKGKPGFLSGILGNKDEIKKPYGEWDAVRAARSNLTVALNRKAGILSISFDTPSPEGSASIIRYYLEEAKSRLQEEALERANDNKRFIAEQVSKTPDPLTRERLYTLLAQELEREMLAKNRGQFGFRIIDSPRPPDRKVRPRRLMLAMLASALSFLFFAVLLYFVQGKPSPSPPGA